MRRSRHRLGRRAAAAARRRPPRARRGRQTRASSRRPTGSGRRRSPSRGSMMPMTVNGRSSSRMVRPTTDASRPNARVQKPSLITTTAGPPALASSAVNPRPASGRTPSIGSSSLVACERLQANRLAATRARSSLRCRQTPRSARRAGCAAESRGSRAATPARASCWYCGRSPRRRRARRCPRTGAGRSSTVSMTLKIAVLAPIPSASVSSATTANPGLATSRRTA